MPKAEVHAHLEGCFEPGVLEQWATQAHVLMPRPRERLFEFDGLADFLYFLDWACGLASTRQRLAELSYGYSRRLADAGAGYADVIINPTHWPAWHGRLPDMIDAIDAGLSAAEQDGLPPVGLCMSLFRTQSSDAAAELVDALVALRHPRVVALSIDGNEAAAGRTGPRFAEAFRRAGAAGLRRTVHAGESRSPDGVRDAIELLGADRIDHGVRAIEDPELVGLLVDRQIPLGVCPTSNLKLGVYPWIESHPIDRLRLAGVAVSINTDDPVLLGASLVGEYALCSKAFSWSDDDLRALAHNSIAATLANADVKAAADQGAGELVNPSGCSPPGPRRTDVAALKPPVRQAAKQLTAADTRGPADVPWPRSVSQPGEPTRRRAVVRPETDVGWCAHWWAECRHAVAPSPTGPSPSQLPACGAALACRGLRWPPTRPCARRCAAPRHLRGDALRAGDQPFGAVVLRGESVVGAAPSRVVTAADPTAHAEMEAIRDAARRLRTRDLSGCVLVSTSRPCRMCEAAAGWAGISRMVYGEALTDAGAPR